MTVADEDDPRVSRCPLALILLAGKVGLCLRVVKTVRGGVGL